MKIPYYPGCTLETTARNFSSTAISAAALLDVEMVELDRWNCCGGVYSLATDDSIRQIAPIRNLVRVQQSGADRVVTLCAMCYNTLKRANLSINTDVDRKDKINLFMDREEDYDGRVKVLHMLELLRDEVGFDRIAEKVKKPLSGLKVAPFYGCMLLRPREVGLDDVEGPTVLDRLLSIIGAEVIDDPYKTECCGSYQTVNQVDVVIERTRQIISSARKRGADAVVVSCPLCHFNLDARQRDVERKYRDFGKLPVLYFTQLLAMALGSSADICEFDAHHVDPRQVLEEKGLIGTE